MSAAANAAGWLYRTGLIGPAYRKTPKPVPVTVRRKRVVPQAA